MSAIRFLLAGQLAELPRDASGADLIAWARARAFPGVRPDKLSLVFRGRFIEPSDSLATLEPREGEPVVVVESTCMHTSPYDPARGVYLCGWC
jgi:hypothetical protein